MNVEKVMEIIRKNELDDGYMEDQLKYDIERLGSELAKDYVVRFSPSKLGKLGFLGLRKLAQIKRDHPEIFDEIQKVW